MQAYRLTDTGDIDLDMRGRATLLSRELSFNQILEHAINLFRGAWFLLPMKGIDYASLFLLNDTDAINTAITRELEQHELVESVTSVNTDVFERTGEVNFEVIRI